MEHTKKTTHNDSLFKQILPTMFILVLALFGILLVLILLGINTALTDNYEQSMDTQQQVVLLLMEESRTQVQNCIALVQDSPRIAAVFADSTNTAARQTAQEYLVSARGMTNISYLVLFNAAGTPVLTSERETPHIAPELASLVQSVSSGQTVQANLVTDTEYLFASAAPIFANGRIAGAIAAVQVFSDTAFIQKIKLLTECEVTFFNNDIRIATTIPSSSGTLTGTALNDDAILNTVYTEQQTHHGKVSVGGVDMHSSYFMIPTQDGARAMLFFGTPLETIQQVRNTIFTIMLPGIICIIVVQLVTLTAMLHHKVITPLKRAEQAVANLNGTSGSADLTYRVQFKHHDEIGAICIDINTFIVQLSEIIVNLSEAEQGLAVIGQELTTNAIESASSIAQILANIESIHNMIGKQNEALAKTQRVFMQTAKSAQGLDGLIDSQTAGIVESSAAVEQMIGNIESVTATVSKVSADHQVLLNLTKEGSDRQEAVHQSIMEMSSESSLLIEANKMISSIASQTNLLAMNAAIEAAHAGEAGKGFSVVADEIRKLAEDSSKQSHSIGQELKKITGTIQNVVAASEKSRTAFSEVADKVGNIDQVIQQINNAMSEQQQASKQVLEALASIKNDTMQVQATSKQITENMDQVRESSQQLEEVCVSVKSSMDEMSIGAKQINTAANNVSNLAVDTGTHITDLKTLIDKFKLQ